MKVWQWQQLQQSSGGFYERVFAVVSIFHDLELDDIEQMPMHEVMRFYSEVAHLGNVHEHNSDTIHIGVELRLIDFNKLRFGQFIDLETYVTTNWIDNFQKIIATMYLQHSGGGLTELQPEPFEHINIEYRAKLVDEIEINHVYGSVQKYLKWRESFFRSLGLLDNEEEDEDEDEEQPEPQPKKGNPWIEILNVLSKNDLTKFDKLLNANVHLVYNQILYLKNQTKSDMPTL